MKRTFFFTAILTTLLYLLCFPEAAFQASKNGLLLWFHTLLPSLLPFLILSDFLIHTGKIPVVLAHFTGFFRICFGLTPYGAYAFFLGLFCGYPMGAKLTADLFREKKITADEAHYLLTFSNNASPMFITSYILLNALKVQGLTLATFGILYLSTFLTSLIFRFRCNRFSAEVPEKEKETSLRASLGRLIDVSIMNGFETITRLGGYIILFSIGASVITKITAPFPALSWILPGVVEITTGIQTLSAAPLDFGVKYLLVLVVTSFGGFSAMAQTKGMLNGTPLSIRVYFVGKLVNAGCTFLLGSLFLILQTVF
ncbi:MAG: sporulation protein [Clostridiales bacterium]|nr:sporulation protein [Clostridiales bacterium]